MPRRSAAAASNHDYAWGSGSELVNYVHRSYRRAQPRSTIGLPEEQLRKCKMGNINVSKIVASIAGAWLYQEGASAGG